jgi:hypothetical protein
MTTLSSSRAPRIPHTTAPIPKPPSPKPPSPKLGAIPLRDIRWSRPLLVLAASMAVLAVVAVVGLLVDPREVTGLPVWAKPLKFALSTGIYAVTLAWLVGQVVRFRRIVAAAATIAALALGIELVIITAFAVVAETSHFNMTTPLHTVGWTIMGTSIGVLWVATWVVAAVLFVTQLGDRARSLAVRAGAVIAIIGMGLAFLMTTPTSGQLADFQGIAGAHTVGLADGGPGLPILGWSTVAGDLRIPHFVGMHALQALPILALVLELAARGIPRLADAVIRFRLIAIAAVTYLAVVGLTTWQALIGQSIVQPAGAILTAGIGLAVATAAAIVVALAAPARIVSTANELT